MGDAMRGLLLSLLFLAVTGVMPGVLSGAADAQKGLSTGANLDGIDNANRIAENARRKLDGMRKEGVDALQKQDFAAADKIFTNMAAQNPTTTDAHYLLGIAKLGLQNWAEAKQVLEIAVKKEAARPEPKARLGVAYLRLNDTAGAMKQREELAGMGAKCNGCPDAPRIAENLALLDRAIAARTPVTPPG
jgi:Flp pilus assembly protein TadD